MTKKIIYKQKQIIISGSGELEFEEFVTLASRFMVEEDAEAMQAELKEAFRLYDKEGLYLLTFSSLNKSNDMNNYYLNVLKVFSKLKAR